MTKPTLVTRRDFMKGSVAGVVAYPALGALHPGLGSAERSGGRVGQANRPPRSARVVLVRDERVLNASHDVDVAVLDRMLADTVTRLTGQKTPRAAWQALFKPSDTVGVVPTDHLNPTHAELIQAVKKALVDAGIPAGQIREAQGRIDKPRACTALIAMPALKAHWLTGLGAAMKLYILYSGRPSSYHDQNNANLAETWLLPDVKGKTKLVLLDALRPLCDKGPQPDPRYLWDYKGLIASTDPVAVDAVGLRIVMARRKALRGEDWPLSPPPLCVSAADEKFGLGTSRMSEIALDKSGWLQDILV